MSLVPTSAHSGDGMGNLIALLVELTQTMLARRLAHCDELRAQVMEVSDTLLHSPDGVTELYNMTKMVANAT